MQVTSGALLIRLFNAESEQEEHVLTLGSKPIKAGLVDLKGTEFESLAPRANADGSYALAVKLRRFGLCTLRCQI
jgi:hypothetical protein